MTQYSLPWKHRSCERPAEADGGRKGERYAENKESSENTEAKEGEKGKTARAVQTRLLALENRTLSEMFAPAVLELQ